MRKFLILFLVAVFGVNSCSSDDSSSSLADNLLIGSWNITKEIALDENGEIVEMDYIELPEVCPNDILEISEDNTVKITDYEYDLALAKCEVYNETIGTWNSALGFLYLSLGSASARKCELMTLNADIMVLEYPLPEDIVPNYELNVTKIRLVLERIK